ncbi:MAG TPA: prealbumin-like fold domain-containing protein, partial [Acidimicrobiia bacterium]|nr:prealbumin-like fold domain-containing protein [Acidimicrobiia bacterium]
PRRGTRARNQHHDPGAFAEDPERLAPNPERAALGDFSASAECQTKSGASASAAAQPPSTETLARVLPESPAPGAPDPTTVAAGLPSVVVSHTSASTGYRIDPERGTVARAEALVRGISITIPAVGGQPAIVIRIDGAYSLAESAAKGVPGTTGTVHRRVLWGVHIAGGGQHFERELCATEECLFQARDALNQLLGDRGRARVPTAEPALSAGSPGGYTAAVQMEKFEAINRSVVDGDSAKEVPVMDIVLFNDSLVAGKQRQIIQLAGVKTNSQYGIFCLGGGTVQDGECVLPVVPGGSITVSLTDDEGTPLPGAEFQAAGAERAACTTDGEGRCHMIDLKPGTYTVTETTPPPDYAPAAPLRVQVRSGSAASATFVNFRGVGYIEISLSDAVSGAPLAGGTFEVQSGGNPFVKCTTNRAGLCEFVISGGREANEVPLGQYAVRQLTAPKGYEPISDPTSVSLTKPQQVARLPYTNGPAGGVDADVLGGIEGPATLAPVAATDGGGLGGLFDALDDLGQWIRRNPGEALMFASSLALFASPFWASWRRRLLLGIPRRPGT